MEIPLSSSASRTLVNLYVCVCIEIKLAIFKAMLPTRGIYLNLRLSLLTYMNNNNTLCMQTGLRYVFDGVALKNNDAMEELLQSSIELAVGMSLHSLYYSASGVAIEQKISERDVLITTGFHAQHPASRLLLRLHRAKQ